MRVHGDKILRRRENVTNLRHYKDGRSDLEADFQFMCGYCGKDGKIMHEKFHIDHFVPRAVDGTRENDYYNLVLACPRCNLSKSKKWPTGDKDRANDGERGFVDPATDEYDLHMGRNEEGFVVGLTPVGKSMCHMLHLDIRRTDLYWKIGRLHDKKKELEKIYLAGMMTEPQKDLYIKLDIVLTSYIDEAFIKGE